ncbi:MAG: tetratricopeptide repeat protein [Bacteroidota bacterium]
MKTYPLLLIFLLSAAFVQSQPGTDSLREILKNTKPDRNTLQLYLDKMQDMTPDETGSIQVIGEWVIKHTGQDSLREMRAMANLILGKIYVSVLNFEEGARYLTNALSIAEESDFYIIQAQALNAIGAIYNRNEQSDLAVGYYKKSFFISKTNNYIKGMALAEYNVGKVMLAESRRNAVSLRTSINLMLHAFSVVNQLKDTQSVILQSWGLAVAYTAFKNYDSALIMIGSAEKLIIATGKEFAYVTHYNQVAKIYHNEKKYQEAIKYYDKGLAHAKKYNVPRWLCMYYSGMADTYENMGDYKKANFYNQLNINMHDALVSKENFAAAADIQNRYERAKKDNEILKLAAANRQKSTLNKVLFGSTAGLLAIGFLGYMNFKNRSKISKQQEELQLQKIKDLEKDKQLISIDAMLKGQEEERSRIAKDLHDGLGGLLSGTKLSFMNVKENISLSPENSRQFDRSLSMLDNTIIDLRKVAHNLMPEALVKFGLHEALRDFCDSIQTSFGIKILYQQCGEKRKLDNTAEVFIYRIIQELVNNAVKHACATQIFVQLAISQHKTGITVEDNGKGFDKKFLPVAKGAGMANIIYRVQYFSGISDIVSSPGNGTSVNIELNA